MKNIKFLIMILCLSSMAMVFSCEKADLQKSLPNDTGKILPRTDCENCPNITDCCCFILLQDVVNGSANLTICGTTDGAGSCSGGAVGGCSAFSNGEQTFMMNSGNPRVGFCMDPGNTFRITNNSSNSAAIYVSCQGDLGNPQILTITIPGNSSVVIGSNGDCEIEDC